MQVLFDKQTCKKMQMLDKYKIKSDRKTKKKENKYRYIY